MKPTKILNIAFHALIIGDIFVRKILLFRKLKDIMGPENVTDKL